MSASRHQDDADSRAGIVLAATPDETIRPVVRRADSASVNAATPPAQPGRQQPSARSGIIRSVDWWLLEGIPAEEVRQLLQVARRRTFNKGEVVFHRGDPGDSLHLIVKGRFSIQLMTPIGTAVTVAIMGPGESFGEMALIGGKAPRSATVEALEPAETFCVTEADFARLRKAHPEVNEHLITFLARELRRLNERLLEALYSPAERRVLRRVGELAEFYGEAGDDPVEIPLTQEQLAELAGASRATVNAVLGDAQERGLVELTRGRVRVLDAEGLARRAR